MIKMSIPSGAINKLNKEIKDAQKIYEQKLSDEINKGMMMVHISAQRNITSQISVNNTFMASLIPEFKVGTLEANVHHTSAHAPFIEFGTKRKFSVDPAYAKYASQFKGSKSGTFKKLLENIGVWAKKASIPDEAVFPIALSIARNGIPAKPFLYPAFEENRGKIINNIKKLKI